MIEFTEDDVRRLLPMRDCIEAMRSCFRALASGEAVNQPRRRMHLPTGSVFHALAGAHGGYFGTKVYATNVKHGAHFFVLLFDAGTARPLARFEANYLGQIRTGAVTGLAVDLLAPQQPCTVAVIGSGFQARSQVDAVRAVRDIRELRVWSRNADKRARFASEVDGIPSASSDEAVNGADIVVTATWAKDPVLRAEAVKPGALVCAVGSNDPRRRELPGDLVLGAADLVIDDLEQGRAEAGDFVLALGDDWSRVRPLAAVVAAAETRKAGHVDRPLGTTVFKSVGLGVEDVAAAALVYERAGAATPAR